MRNTSRVALVLFWVFFGLFCADVLVGRLGVLMGSGSGSLLGDVGQFLLLAVAAALLTVEALRRERLKQETADREESRENEAAPAPPRRQEGPLQQGPLQQDRGRKRPWIARRSG